MFHTFLAWLWELHTGLERRSCVHHWLPILGFVHSFLELMGWTEEVEHAGSDWDWGGDQTQSHFLLEAITRAALRQHIFNEDLSGECRYLTD